MGADRTLLFDHHNGLSGMCAHDGARGREPDDPTPHNEYVGPLHAGARYAPKSAEWVTRASVSAIASGSMRTCSVSA